MNIEITQLFSAPFCSRCLRDISENLHSHAEHGAPVLGQVLWQTRELICPVTAAEFRYSHSHTWRSLSVQIEHPACL